MELNKILEALPLCNCGLPVEVHGYMSSMGWTWEMHCEANGDACQFGFVRGHTLEQTCKMWKELVETKKG